jgi:hypothetical protein
MTSERSNKSDKQLEKQTQSQREISELNGIPETVKKLRDAPKEISVKDLLRLKLFLDKLINETKKKLEEVSVTDLWTPIEPISSYWILLMTGIDQRDEIDIASSILIWKEFFTKNTANIVCLQSSDRKDFKFCNRYFKINSYPALIFSDNPEMERSIILDGSILHKIMGSKGGLRAFLTQIHAFIENGVCMEEIRGKLNTERFWDGLKMVYKEIKSLVSISIKSDL